MVVTPGTSTGPHQGQYSTAQHEAPKRTQKPPFGAAFAFVQACYIAVNV